MAKIRVVSLDLPSAEGDEPVSELMAAAFMFDEDRVSFRGSRTDIVLESAPLSVSSSATVATTRLASKMAPITRNCNGKHFEIET